MFNLVLQFAKDATPDVDADELLIFLKAGKSAQIKQVVDRFGRLFVEEFRHFMKLNDLTAKRMNAKPNKNGPSTGVGQKSPKKSPKKATSSQENEKWLNNSKK